MATSNFAFIPRKLARKACKGNVDDAQQRPSPQVIGNGLSPTNTEHKESGAESRTDLKGKGRAVQRISGKLLSDEEYCDLLWLSLSDHAIWSNHDLHEEMDGRDGFVDLRNIMEYSPLFTVLPSFPPESTLARSAKLSPLFEVRMIVADSWATGTSHARAQQDRGGFEIRRTDWSKVKDRIRKYTSFYWDGKTVYVENIPVQCRSKPAILRLLHDLLHDGLNPGASQSIVEYIQFLPHRDDRPDTPEPFKCKGFTFVTLSSSKDVDSLLERWPWESSKVEVGKTHKAALESGFRALSKRKWEKLKEEYLLYQQQLLADAASHTALPPRPRRAMVEDTRETIEKIQPPGPPPSIAQTTYPLNCLIFVKNIQPDTNKTTLRNLFSSAFGKPEGLIDYVDYTKGLDTCYLRLSTSESARELVNHFAETQISQSDGLDAIGTKGVKSNVISMELVQGRREELYWEKVPLKIRQQAIAKANTVVPKDREDGADSCSMGGLNEDRRKQKRRKHN